jgi:hypothetical protein
LRTSFCSWWIVTCLAAVAWAAPAVKEKAKEQDKAPPVLEPLPVELPAPGTPAVFQCRITDKSGVFGPVLAWRAQGSAEAYVRVSLAEGAAGVYEGALAVPEGVEEVEYFFEAYDTRGNGPASAGTADNPLRATVATPTPPAPPVVEPPAASVRKPQVPAAALTPGVVPVGRVVAVGAFAAGASALLLAGVYGLMASSNHAVFRSTYDPGERPAAAARVRTESLAADVSLGLGLGLGLAGAASWVLSSGGP